MQRVEFVFITSSEFANTDISFKLSDRKGR